MAEVPLASEYRLVVYKQVDAGFYPVLSYVFSVIIMSVPLALTESTILGTLIYWMTSFANDAGRYFFFIFVFFVCDMAVSVAFRFIAYSLQDSYLAMNLAGPVTAMMMMFGGQSKANMTAKRPPTCVVSRAKTDLFLLLSGLFCFFPLSGFLITADKIPNWLIEMFWTSPFSWGVRSLALNEFHSGRYAEGQGDAYLSIWQIKLDDRYKWAGVAFLAGLFLVFLACSALVLKHKRSWLTVGTRRDHSAEECIVEEDGRVLAASMQVEVPVQARIGAKSTSAAAAIEDARVAAEANQLAFQRMDLAFVDLRYTVTVTEIDDATGMPRTYERALLQGINGYAKAGELTALMGSSGAGKVSCRRKQPASSGGGSETGSLLLSLAFLL